MIDLDNFRAQSFKQVTSESRIQTLERIVLDLMMEIEALRMTVIKLTDKPPSEPESNNVLEEKHVGVSGDHSLYAQAYMETAWVTHWAAGPLSGWDKLIERFYHNEAANYASRKMGYRELIMLRRLGYTPTQIDQYMDKAEAAETCT